MNTQVYVQATYMIESLVTIFAGERPLSSVEAEVCLQSARLSEGLVTACAVVTFFSCVEMDTLVCLQLTCLTETLLTPVTMERFVASVETHVCLQVNDTFATLITHVGFLSCVIQGVFSFCVRLYLRCISVGLPLAGCRICGLPKGCWGDLSIPHHLPVEVIVASLDVSAQEDLRAEGEWTLGVRTREGLGRDS